MIEIKNSENNRLDTMRIINLSTDHIRQETAELLDEQTRHDKDCLDSIAVYKKDEYGYFVYIMDYGEEANEDLPEDLKDCIRLAKSNDCEMIIFDRDFDPISGNTLKTYEW